MAPVTEVVHACTDMQVASWPLTLVHKLLDQLTLFGTIPLVDTAYSADVVYYCQATASQLLAALGAN